MWLSFLTSRCLARKCSPWRLSNFWERRAELSYLGLLVVPPRLLDRSSRETTDKRSVEQVLAKRCLLKPGARQAAQRLVDLAGQNGGMATPGSLTFSIRCLSPAWNNPLSLAWINPDPDYSGGHANTNFDFGMDNYELENKPPELVQILKMWTSQFKDDPFRQRILRQKLACLEHQPSRRC